MGSTSTFNRSGTNPLRGSSTPLHLWQMPAGEAGSATDGFLIPPSGLLDRFSSGTWATPVRPTTKSTDETVELDETWQGLYNMKDNASVLKFVRAHPCLLAMLAEAPIQVEKHFVGARIGLEVVDSYDVPNQQELHISICTDLSPKDAFVKMKAFSREWWLSLPDEILVLANISPQPL